MAKRNTLQLEYGALEKLLIKLDEVEGDMKAAVTDAFNQAGETIEYDTLEAIKEANLPKEGEYSRGNTEKSIVRNPKTEWSGTYGSIAVGFDYGKKGAGGFLITGTPRMRPDYALEKIYTQKKYMSDIRKDMVEVVGDYIKDKMEG